MFLIVLACMHTCMYIYFTHTRTCIHTHGPLTYMHTYINIYRRREAGARKGLVTNRDGKACMYICVCVNIYIYIYIYIYMVLWPTEMVSMSVYVCIWICCMWSTEDSWWCCMRVCMCMCVYMYVMCDSSHIYTYICTYIHTTKTLMMMLYAYLHVCICAHIHWYVHTYTTQVPWSRSFSMDVNSEQ
jgi:hypothetical protein